MGESKVKELDRNELPWYYRLILKIPAADFLENISSGLFWAMIVPIFLGLESFLALFLLLYFPFPMNVGMALVIPVVILVMFLRISLERFLNYWNGTVKDSQEWNIDKTMPEYLELLKKRNKEKT